MVKFVSLDFYAIIYEKGYFMDKASIHYQLSKLLERAKKVSFEQVLKEEQKPIFEEIDLYILDDALKDEVLALEAKVKALSPEAKESYKGKAFFEYAKIINPTYPAFKYSFYVARKPVEIFDKEKVKERIAGEKARWRNMQMASLEKEITHHIPPLSLEEADFLRQKLHKRLEEEEQKLEEVIAHWDEYDAVITTHAYCKTYPALYYTLDTSSDYEGEVFEEKMKHYKKRDTHLRSGVPNLLWYKDERPFSSLRANDKINRIIQTYTPYCGTIYIKKKEKLSL